MPGTVPHVLVADGDPAIRFYLLRNLKAEGYAVADAACGQAVLQAVAESAPDLIVCGLELPDMDGMILIRSVRELSPLPIVALSEGADEDVSVQAFDRGADDVVAKPFGIRELAARVRNALRRVAQARGETPRVTVGDLEVDLMHRRIQVRGMAVHLTPIEYEVLRHLAEGGGRVLGHHELLAAAWGATPPGRVQYLRVAIRALRRKIEEAPEQPRHILTEPRVGYRLAPPVRWTRPGEARTCA